MAQRKEDKRKAAENRQAEYDKLSTKQKIERAKKRRGKSEKEIARLNSL